MAPAPDQVKAIATRPEQSRTRPVTATARKLLDANSSRMVHRLRFVPLPEGDAMFRRTVKKNPLRIPVSTGVDDFVQHLFERVPSRNGG
jgi:hypothetical protein